MDCEHCVLIEPHVPDCKGLGKYLGHKFEARYDEECGESKNHLPDHVTLALGAGQAVAICEAEKSRKQVYIHDICVRCGTTIKRSS